MPLSITTRGSLIKNRLPEGDALLKCLEVVTTNESADYLYNRFLAIVQKANKLNDSQPVLDKIAKFREDIYLQNTISDDPWMGQTAEESNDFQKLQRNIAAQSLVAVAAKVQGELVMDYAISEEAQLVRSYKINDEDVDSDTSINLDKLFNAWLAENQIVSQDSMLYASNQEGELLTSSTTDLRQKLLQIIDDKKKGFQAFLQEKGMQLVLVRHPFPPAQERRSTPKEATSEVNYERPRSSGPR